MRQRQEGRKPHDAENIFNFVCCRQTLRDGMKKNVKGMPRVLSAQGFLFSILSKQLMEKSMKCKMNISCSTGSYRYALILVENYKTSNFQSRLLRIIDQNIFSCCYFDDKFHVSHIANISSTFGLLFRHIRECMC